MSKEKDGLPFGGFFIIIGAVVLCGYAVPLSGGNDLVPLGGLVVGGWLGYIFEHVLFRIIVIGLFILMIVARQAFFGAVFEDMNAFHFKDNIAPGLASAALSIAAPAAHASEPETISAKGDYVTCWKQPCVLSAGSEWSERNPNGVGVAVRMGTKSILTDYEIKTVLTGDFKHYGLTDIKFFFEQNDTPATGITYHIRGGTEGIYLLNEMRPKVPKTAKRAKNKNAVFTPF